MFPQHQIALTGTLIRKSKVLKNMVSPQIGLYIHFIIEI